MTQRNLSEIVSARRMIEGPSDKLRAVSAVKYPWVNEIWDVMKANNWDHHQVPMVRDRVQFQELKPGQKTAIKRSLAFLSNLDSIQVDNLAENVSQTITDPNVRECVYRQQFEEVIHVKSYSAMVEVLFPQNPMEIYDMYHVVPELGAKNDFIIEQSKEVSANPTSVNKVKAIVSNIALEGIYFFSGFTTFYAVGRESGGMQGAVDMIKYINRDELVHLHLFNRVFSTVRQERPELFGVAELEIYRDVLRGAALREIKWGEYLIEEGVPGLTNDIFQDYVMYLANLRANDIGLGNVFDEVSNPIPWVDRYSAINGSQKNFFETKVTGYSEDRPQFKSRRRPEILPPSSGIPVSV